MKQQSKIESHPTIVNNNFNFTTSHAPLPLFLRKWTRESLLNQFPHGIPAGYDLIHILENCNQSCDFTAEYKKIFEKGQAMYIP